MIKPINGHVLIEPVKHESFIPSDKGTYDEVGVVIDFAEELGEKKGPFYNPNGSGWYDKIIPAKLKKGELTYFDSWLAARYPKNDKEFYWLVKYEDIRAIDDGN